ERWHGCPAQRTDLNYLKVPPAQRGTLRRAVYSALLVLGFLVLYLPLVQAGGNLALGAASSLAHAVDPSATAGTSRGVFTEALFFSLLLFFGFGLVGLLAMGTVPRTLNLFLTPDKVYPLYGFYDAVHRAIGRLVRIRFYTLLFGDSSYIVHYLQWLGFHLSPVVQTGSNFGTEVTHGNPLLCSVGSGTMVADAVSLVNDEVSSTSFRVARASLGPRNFVGNFVSYPAGARTGDNVLLATKVMVPLDGKIREGVGLLGAPCFEIPRTVERDTQFDHLLTGEAQRRGLAAKNWYNLRTIGIFLFTRWVSVLLFALLYLAAFDLVDGLPAWVNALLIPLGLPVTAVYVVLVQRCVEALHPLRPTICSIYHRDFWSVERSWKVHPSVYLHAFDGTPFKNLLWRLMGVRVGKRVFDDGLHLSEPTLAAIGDECVLNHTSTIQCHSQEDGTFKCDRTTIGAGCTLGVGAFVHYGVTMSDGAVLAPDSFLMKGEEVPPRARWGGNPARES
ncbi:MAG TPA: Pls/PosA family non-ribosomal peptide synthetase, partial [Gemmatimonadales bacterium]|nr:Pls/PosA family non-ribosomal peptide synthetase [Gemmatimonadales bacterium]